MFLGSGGSGLSSRPFAEATEATIDMEVSRLLREAEQSAVALIRSHRDEFDQLVALLLDKETIDGADDYRIVGRPRPGRRPDEMIIVPHSASAAGRTPAHAVSAGGIPAQPTRGGA